MIELRAFMLIMFKTIEDQIQKSMIAKSAQIGINQIMLSVIRREGAQICRIVN